MLVILIVQWIWADEVWLLKENYAIQVIVIEGIRIYFSYPLSVW